MPSALHRRATTEICEALRVAHGEMLENDIGYEGWLRMRDAVARKEIPRYWPGADAETIKLVSSRLPVVSANAVTPHDEEWMLKALTGIFPPGKPKSQTRSRDTLKPRGSKPSGRLTKKTTRRSKR